MLRPEVVAMLILDQCKNEWCGGACNADEFAACASRD